jgi:hypothetical protein
MKRQHNVAGTPVFCDGIRIIGHLEINGSGMAAWLCASRMVLFGEANDMPNSCFFEADISLMQLFSATSGNVHVARKVLCTILMKPIHRTIVASESLASSLPPFHGAASRPTN